jgi:hypothetical protein
VTTTYRAARDGAVLEWVLEIAGLGVRYYSGPVPPPDKATDLAIAAGDYVDIPAIVSVSDYSERVEASRGWYDGGAVTVELATAGTSAAVGDPCLTLSAVGRRGAADYAQLLTPIARADVAGATFNLDRAWTGGAAGLTHIDREAIEYTYAALPGPVYQMTIVSRARLGSWTQRHNTDRLAALLPECTSTVTHWLGRPAYLYYAARYPGYPTLSSPVLWAPMILTGSPAFSGPRVSLTMSPITALMERKSGGELQRSRSVGLLQGVHRFWDEGPSVWSTVQVLPSSACATMTANPAGSAASQTDLTAVHFPWHAALFWAAGLPTAGPGGGSAGVDHPRWGHIRRGESVSGGAPLPSLSLRVNGVAGNALTHSFFVPAITTGPTVDIDKDAVERVCLDITAGPGTTTDMLWPDGLSALVAARARTTPALVDGCWAEVQLSTLGVSATPNDRAARASFARWGDLLVCLEWVETEREPGSYDQGLGNRRDLYDRIIQPRPRRWEAGGVAEASDVNPRDLVLYPIRPREDATVSVVSDTGAGQARHCAYALHVPPRVETVYSSCDIALAWYEQGEPYLLLEADPGIEGEQTVSVSWTGPSGTSRSVDALVVGPASSVAVAGASGYLLQVLYPSGGLPSFGDWPGQERSVITPLVSFGTNQKAVSSSSVLLEILLAGGDSATFGDSQPWGLGLPESLVDVASIRDIIDPAGVAGWNVSLGPDSDQAALVDAILVLTGYQLAIRRDETGARLAAVPSGLTAAAATTHAIDEGSICGMPASALDEQVVSQYEVTISDEQTITYVDQRSVATHGQSDSLKIDLRGVQLGGGTEPILTMLQPVIARCAETLGSPRRLWTVELPIRDALALYPGAAVSVTSRDLYGLSGPPGVDSVVARVQSITHRLMGATATAELTYHGVACTLVHAAMIGTATKANSIKVSELDLTGGEDPSLGRAWMDTSDFIAGDSVHVSLAASQDAVVARTIQAITSLGGGVARVDFTAAHGVAVGQLARIAHRPRAAAPTRVVELAYLSPWAAGGAWQYS